MKNLALILACLCGAALAAPQIVESSAGLGSDDLILVTHLATDYGADKTGTVIG